MCSLFLMKSNWKNTKGLWCIESGCHWNIIIWTNLLNKHNYSNTNHMTWLLNIYLSLHFKRLNDVFVYTVWRIFIDGTNHTDGTWRHSDGSSMFLNWQPGEPNKDFEHCVIMFDDGKYNNIPCDLTMYFICERQLNI